MYIGTTHRWVYIDHPMHACAVFDIPAYTYICDYAKIYVCNGYYRRPYFAHFSGRHMRQYANVHRNPAEESACMPLIVSAALSWKQGGKCHARRLISQHNRFLGVETCIERRTRNADRPTRCFLGFVGDIRRVRSV